MSRDPPRSMDRDHPTQLMEIRTKTKSKWLMGANINHPPGDGTSLSTVKTLFVAHSLLATATRLDACIAISAITRANNMLTNACRNAIASVDVVFRLVAMGAPSRFGCCRNMP